MVLWRRQTGKNRPRWVGQQPCRVPVTGTYERHCAGTGERSLPTLEAARVLPVSAGGKRGQEIWLPPEAERPGREFLEWHGEVRFRG